MPDGQPLRETSTLDSSSGLDIPFQRYVLPNGLRLLVHEDHKRPVVSVNTWFGVGSKDEPPGRTGFAHLFEHLLFKGSRAWPDSWHTTMEGLGAQGINGTTNQDRTNFFQTIPVGALDMVLAMEADRVENLLDSIDAPALESEVNVVLNEKLQREGAPGGRMFETLTRTFYPVGHPYAHTVLGSVADVSSANLKAVEDWHSQYYGASNCVLVLAGAISGDLAFDLVERRMGARFAGAPNVRVSEWIPPHMPNRVVLSDHITHQNLTLLWRAPSLQSDESLVLHLFAQMLSVGARSLLQSTFLDTELALGALAVMDARYLTGEFSIGLSLRPGVDPARMEALIIETLREALSGGLSDETLARRLRGNRFGDMRTLESLEVKAEHLAYGELFAGDAHFIAKRMGRTDGLSLDAVLEVARKWLAPPPYVIRIDPFVARTRIAPPAPAPAVHTRPVPATFPKVEKFQLDNGLKIQVVNRPGTPTVESALMFPGRLGRETMQNAGLPAMTLALCGAGFADKDRYQLAEELEDIGAQVGAAAGEHYCHLSLSVPRGDFERQMRVLSDQFLRPVFPEEEVERYRANALAGVRSASAAPTAVASRILLQKAYGARHLANVPGIGTEASLAGFTRADVVAMHDSLIVPADAHLLLVGDLAKVDVEGVVARIWGDMQARGPVVQARPDPIMSSPGRYAAHGKLGEQVFLAGTAAKPNPAPSMAEIAVLDHIIGGSFSSRLNSVLREEKGWTYGIESSLAPERERFSFSVSSMIQADRAIEALDIVQSILARTALTKDITAAEVAAAREVIDLTLSARWESNQEVISTLMIRTEQALPDGGPTFAEELAALTVAQLQDAARLAADPNPMTWVIGFDPDGPAAADVDRAGIPVLTDD